MKKLLKIVEFNKASAGMRFLNLIIDRTVVSIFFFLFGFLGVFIDNILGIDFFYSTVSKLSQMDKLMDILITSSIYFLYTFLMEYFTKGRTIGKYITGTRVIRTDGQNPTFEEYLIRNISRLVPFDAFSFLGGGNGWHDSWSDTRVINIKNYEAEKQAKDDINSIGTKELV